MDHSGRISYSGKWSGRHAGFFYPCSAFVPFSGSCSLYAPICRRKAYRYAGVTAYPPANYLADCRSKISGRISVGALFDITYPRLSGQFMVFSPAGRTYRCGRNYRFVYRVDFLIRHICGCRGLGFGFDRKSDYCFSLHPGGGFFVVYRSRLYSRYSFV